MVVVDQVAHHSPVREGRGEVGHLVDRMEEKRGKEDGEEMTKALARIKIQRISYARDFHVSA